MLVLSPRQSAQPARTRGPPQTFRLASMVPVKLASDLFPANDTGFFERMQSMLDQCRRSFGRKHLAWVANAQRIECRPQSRHAIYLIGVEHLGQKIALLHS